MIGNSVSNMCLPFYVNYFRNCIIAQRTPHHDAVREK